MNPLDRLTTIISELMGKEPSDPDVLKAVVEVVMAIREPTGKMIRASWLDTYGAEDDDIRDAWQAMIDALLTEGEG